MHVDDFSVGVSLERLFASKRFHYARDILVTSCCSNHAQVRPGDLFVAISGAEYDGHAYADKAIEAGAKAVLSERLLPLQIPQCVVPNSQHALAQLCQQLAGNPTADIHTIGIAGQCNLQTPLRLLESMIDKVGDRPAVFAEASYSDGFETFPRRGRSVSAVQHASWMSNAVCNDCTHGIITLSQRDVVRDVYAATRMSGLLLTGFARQHAEHVRSAKRDHYLRQVLSTLSNESLVIANTDCPIVEEICSTLSQPVLTISLQKAADVNARVLEQCPSEQTFLLSAGSHAAIVRSKIIGAAHIRSCLLAAATGLSLGYELPDIISGLEQVELIPGVLERIECGQSFSVFVDRCASTHELEQTLITLRSVTSGRLICVFGEGASNSQAIRARRGSTVERLADVGVVTNDCDCDVNGLSAAHDILDGYESPAKAHVTPNRIQAIEWALDQARTGDTVLLAGPQNSQERSVASRTGSHADADVARYWLFDMGKQLSSLNPFFPA